MVPSDVLGDLESGVGLSLLHPLSYPYFPLGYANILRFVFFFFKVTDISAAGENGCSSPSEAKPEFTKRVLKRLQARESYFRSRVKGLPFMSLSERKASCVMRVRVRNSLY